MDYLDISKYDNEGAAVVLQERFDGAVVDHIDRDSTNNHPSNLRWVTRSENRLNCDEESRTKKIKEIWRQKNAVTQGEQKW